MGELSDRLLILIVAGTGLAVLLAGWGGGLTEATVGGTTESVVLCVLALFFVATLVGIQLEFDRVD
ncbi:hypothetical protein [Halomontanus rarus]|uniref:hypothetical protein n=1 Tax=Halomontanus rarus TaxID=3034020 RepID=UPI001A985A42